MALWIMQRVVQPGNGADSIVKGRMRRDIGDPLAIDIDLTSVAQAMDILRPGIGPALIGDDFFRTHVASPSSPGDS